MSLARQTPLRWDDIRFDPAPLLKAGAPKPFFISSLGALFADDCLAVLPYVRDGVVDTVFADPPFNLGKEYGEKSNDDLSDPQYLEWCKGWIKESCRTLKRGGAFFLYNLPKWNIPLGAYLSEQGLISPKFRPSAFCAGPSINHPRDLRFATKPSRIGLTPLPSPRFLPLCG